MVGVLFGGLDAPLIGEVAPERLQVAVPKVDLAPGERKVVAVTLQTAAGALTTGLSYTYVDSRPARRRTATVEKEVFD